MFRSRLPLLLMAQVAGLSLAHAAGICRDGMFSTVISAAGQRVAGLMRSAGSGHGCPADLYVNVGSGDDNQRCDSSRKACRTIQAALDRIPLILTSDITVHIADGTYEGEAVLADRGSPNRSRIRLVGEPRATLTGAGRHATGLTVFRVPAIVVENLTVQEFTGSGMVFTYTDPVRVVSCLVTHNGEDGIIIGWSSATIVASVVQHNGHNGISANQAFVLLGSSPLPPLGAHQVPHFTEDAETDSPPVLIDDRPAPTSDTGLVAINFNDGDGVSAILSQVRFAGGADLLGNGRGLHAIHGSDIDLNQRPDVSVYFNRQEQLLADCHGMVSNFGSASVGGTCEVAEYGICHP